MLKKVGHVVSKESFLLIMHAHHEKHCVVYDQLSGELYQVFVDGELLEQCCHKHHCQIMSRHVIHMTVALHTK